MESNRSSFGSRMEIAEAIDTYAESFIADMAEERKRLPRGDSKHLLFSIGETVVNMVKFSARGNPDYRRVTEGVTGDGLPYVIRVIARLIRRGLLSASATQLRQYTALARRLADTLEAAVAQEGADTPDGTTDQT